MDELIARVSTALGVDQGVARSAVGHILAFLLKEAPGPVGELLDKVPGARELAGGAEGAESGGLGSGLGSLLGSAGGLMGLASKLGGLGLDMSKMKTLGHEVFQYAEGVIGKENVQAIANSVPGLSQFI